MVARALQLQPFLSNLSMCIILTHVKGDRPTRSALSTTAHAPRVACSAVASCLLCNSSYRADHVDVDAS